MVRLATSAVDRLVSSAIADGRLHPEAAPAWREYFYDGYGSIPRASAALAALPKGVHRPVAAEVPVPAPGVQVGVSQQTLPVAPRTAAETAAVLGARPGSEWFGIPPGPEDVLAQAAYDRKVFAAATQEEFDEPYIQALMNGPRQMSRAAAIADLSGDPGAQRAAGGDSGAAWGAL
jgi:hypothetical protein